MIGNAGSYILERKKVYVKGGNVDCTVYVSILNVKMKEPKKNPKFCGYIDIKTSRMVFMRVFIYLYRRKIIEGVTGDFKPLLFCIFVYSK